MLSKIRSLRAREILDSRGIPTIEVELETDLGLFKASVPSGTSKGKYEAVELRDNGRSVSEAIKNINEVIGPEIKGKNPENQKEIDELMIRLDGTKNKSKLGANSILAVSIVVCRAGAKAKNVPLWQHIFQISDIKIKSKAGAEKPYSITPSLLLIEGGLHNPNPQKTSLQEFMIVSEGASFKEKFREVKEVYNNLGLILEDRYGKEGTRLGYEGGFVPPIEKSEEVLDLIVKAIEKAGFKNKIKIALDVAASSFYSKGHYKFEGKNLTSKKLLDFYTDILKKYPIISIEDPWDQEDWEGWKSLKTEALIIGDDLTVTNKERVKRAIQEKCIDGIIIKPNQVGTVTETLKCVKIAQEAGLKTIVSHRSGDTLDDFIADLATGIGADFIKTGGPTKEERVVKYNRLLEIEKELS